MPLIRPYPLCSGPSPAITRREPLDFELESAKLAVADLSCQK